MPTAKRIEYIDALRGFTMLLVVIQHVTLFGCDIRPEEHLLGDIFIKIRMPLFFFISGFIAYKDPARWTGAFFRFRLRRKAVVQLIPATVFFIVYTLCFDTYDSPFAFLRDGYGRYWFTPVLFEMFLVYFLTSLLAHRFPKAADPLLLGMLGLMALQGLRETQAGQSLMLMRFTIYLPFFVMGLFARRHSDRFFRLIADSRFSTVAVVLFIGLQLTVHAFDLPRNAPVLRMLDNTLARMAGLLVIFTLFWRHRDYFARGGVVSRTMQFVGRRTLDIYLLHYFFIPDDHMEWLKELLRGDNILLQLLAAGGFSLLVICCCLATSEVIRNSDFLARYLFGAAGKPQGANVGDLKN